MSHRKSSRRNFLSKMVALVPVAAGLPALAQAAATPAAGAAPNATAPSGPFKLAPLPYAYDALEPYIDKQTMTIHHDKHHAAYVANLNKAVAGNADLASRSIEDLITRLSDLPEAIRPAVRNNGGGHLNHSLFWELMTPGGPKTPSGDLAKAIDSTFGSLQNFRKEFNDAGLKRFGSGWVWLVQEKGGKLRVLSTANQDSPISEGFQVLLGNDVWEHAYYLKYQNRRADYLEAWWNVLNWDKVSARLK